jgi:mono/diheme cytochrome c family protein
MTPFVYRAFLAVTFSLVCFAATADEKTKPAGSALTDPEKIKFYQTQVKPILTAHCVKCHGGKPKVKGKFWITGRDAVIEGGETGPAVNLENPEKSLLLEAINYEELEMPPKAKLPQAQIDILTKWVKMGLPWTPGEKADRSAAAKKHTPPKVNKETMSHWAFQPVKRPALPKVKQANWVTKDLDAFILAKLEAAGLTPAKPVDKVALLRRAYYDLTGLPPSPRIVDAFLADKSPDAYAKVVDRLLASPQYGEKWGRHWLDLVHYAETNSFERDNPKPEAWRYRDYVIKSFNDDKPYDRFITEQLAGDELDEVTAESIIATGYYRLGLWDDESANPKLARFDELDDYVATTSNVMMGLTANCGRCHDHKLDPFPQTDYYSMVAIFRGVRSFQNNGRKGFVAGNYLTDISSTISPELKKKYEAAIAEGDKRMGDLNKQISAIEKAAGEKLTGGAKDDFAYESYRLPVLREHVGKVISPADLKKYEGLVGEKKKILNLKSIVRAKALSAKGTLNPPQTHVLIRGTPAAPAAKVDPSYPSVLGWPKPVIPTPKAGAKSSGRRKAFAAWLTNGKNQLTARVMINRIWQHHFGRGIVRSSSNFGLQGVRPTHPLLLDYLADEFVKKRWSMKAMHRMMMLSSTYRMSSRASAGTLKKDPVNDLFSRFDMRRLSAEEIRDSILSLSGRLNLKMGGPSIRPTIPREVLAGQSRPGSGWRPSSAEEQARRSIYVFIKRSVILPIFEQFDVADVDSSCPVRFVTTQPTQALGMLNSKFTNDQAKLLANRLKMAAGDDVSKQVAMALQLAMSRPAKAAEVDRGVKLIKSLQADDGASADDALKIFCLLTLNLNEFMYLD